MAGRRELGFPKTNGCSLKEQLARTTLRNVKSQGHTYVELREDGKRFIFFCTLCLAPCYSDSVLFDHLKGNHHKERLVAAKATLLKPNPWPFSDGVLFFQDSSEEDTESPKRNGDSIQLLDDRIDNGNELAIVCHGGHMITNGNGNHNGSGCIEGSNSVTRRDVNGVNGSNDIVVPRVFNGSEISNLDATFIGVGQIAAKFYLKKEVQKGVCKIWCEWLGMNSNMDSPTVTEHGFAVVTFSYNYKLGRKDLFEDVKYLLTSNSQEKTEDVDHAIRKRKKSFSDPEDMSESLSNQYGSSGEDSPSKSKSGSGLLEGFDDQLLHSSFISNKAIRRELRRHQRAAAERMCDICQQKILPGKDVATLLNRKTGRLACSSRNRNGVFHVFHVSCLVHWILLWEVEIYNKQLTMPKVRRRSRRKNGAKSNGTGKESENKPLTVLCPECQGTGINVYGEEREKPTIPLSEIFRHKIKASDARRAWLKSPEVLDNCSTGFYFPSQSDELVQENVSVLKFLRFYRAGM